jgi:hypothetical protein
MIFYPYISRKEQWYDITPDLLAHYRINVITMVPYSRAHSKQKVTKSSTISKNGTTKKTTVTFLTWYRHFPRKMVGSDSRLADATRLALRRYQVYKHSVHVNSLTLRHDEM